MDRSYVFKQAINKNRIFGDLIAAFPQLKQGDDALFGIITAPDGTVTLYIQGEVKDPPAATLIDAVVAAHNPTPDPIPEPETPPTEILLSLLADVTDVDETKPILEAMLMILGGQT